MDRYAVVGNPIAHSRSPWIHAAFARQTQQDLSYEALLAPLDGFRLTVDAFRAMGGLGLNVTVPFKLEAHALAGVRSDRALRAGAVNTLAWRGDHWFGDNTDGVGLVTDLQHNLACPLAGMRVLLLGAGGASRGVLAPLFAAGVAAIVIANRNVERAEVLAADFRDLGTITAAPPGQAIAGRFDLLVNATSAGLDAGASVAWPEVTLADGAVAYDMVYGKGETEFFRWARQAGAARLADGLGMLVEQAAASFALWRGVAPDTAPVLADLRQLVSAA